MFTYPVSLSHFLSDNETMRDIKFSRQMLFEDEFLMQKI